MLPSGPSTPPPCSVLATELGEDAFATASLVRGWLLVEQPGAWKRDPFATGFDPDVSARLAAQAGEAGLRVLAIRRPAGVTPDPTSAGGRAVFAAYSGPGRTWLGGTRFGHERELPELIRILRLSEGLAPEALGSEALGSEALGSEVLVPEGLVPEAAPLYLVCTHAGRDACCGRDGRPLAAALAAHRPGRVWECSHLGGHRFSANVLVLPSGVLYGRVAPADAGRLCEATDSGELEPELVRGRSAWPPEAQAAEHFVRRRLGLRGIDEVEPLGVDHDRAGRGAKVTVRAGTGHWLVAIAGAPAGARPLSCGAAEPEDPGGWRLVSLEPLRRPARASDAKK